MNWKRVAVGLGRVMKEAVRGVGVAALLGPLALPAAAGDSHSPGAYTKGTYRQ
jgi:hypothetical protein